MNKPPGKYCCDGAFLKMININSVKMSHKTFRHLLLLFIRRFHGGYHHGVNNLHCEELLTIIPHTVVQHVPQHLNWSLGLNRIFFWQVNIIYKDDKLFTQWGPIHTLPSLIQLAHDDILRGNWFCHSGEEEGNTSKLLLVQFSVQ